VASRWWSWTRSLGGSGSRRTSSSKQLHLNPKLLRKTLKMLEEEMLVMREQRKEVRKTLKVLVMREQRREVRIALILLK